MQLNLRKLRISFQNFVDFHQILIAAALRAPRPALARALLAERVRLRPNNAWTWERYGEALEALGDHDGATDAAGRARSLLTN